RGRRSPRWGARSSGLRQREQHRRRLDADDAAVRDTSAGEERRASAVVAHRSARRVTPGLVAALADPSGVVRVEAAAVLLALSKS
ncbi:MAG TPA: hypothetical protein VM513_15290, partial [Kofleriaceae bacterium]|nr:hypothetical protein [Kofleriaceae bacterium]